MICHLPDYNALFLHIPKTGGTWVTNTLDKLGIKRQQPELRTPSFHPRLEDCIGDFDYVFAFVRHPLSWYESYWRYQVGKWCDYRLKKGWHPLKPLQECADDNFQHFISKCLDYEPAFVTRMYEWYLGPPNQDQVVVGRKEELNADFRRFLRMIGCEFDERIVRDSPPFNESDKRPVLWEPELRSDVASMEFPSRRRFYPDSIGTFSSGKFAT